MSSGLDPELRALLVCPVCRGELTDVADGLRCPHDRLVYPIVDGIPWMVPEHARREDEAPAAS
jgi:uncharacterized protein YbaR (Trm112 family)